MPIPNPKRQYCLYGWTCCSSIIVYDCLFRFYEYSIDSINPLGFILRLVCIRHFIPQLLQARIGALSRQ